MHNRLLDIMHSCRSYSVDCQLSGNRTWITVHASSRHQAGITLRCLQFLIGAGIHLGIKPVDFDVNEAAVNVLDPDGRSVLMFAAVLPSAT